MSIDSLVSHQQSVLVSAPFMASLLAHSNVPQQWITKNHPWPLSGGLPPEANADKQTLLITAYVSPVLLDSLREGKPRMMAPN
jgi:hypothetical protein